MTEVEKWVYEQMREQRKRAEERRRRDAQIEIELRSMMIRTGGGE